MAQTRKAAALLLSLVLAGCSSPADVQSDAADTAEGIAEQPLIDQMAEIDNLGWIGTLRDLYPAEYRRLGAHLETQTRYQSDLVAARTDMMREVSPFMAERKRSLQSASDDALVEYLRLNLAVLERLRTENPTACVEVAQGRLNPSIELSDAAWGSMSAVTAQLLVAARAAEQTPIVRVEPSLTPQEQHLWMVEVGNAGATPRTSELLKNRLAAAQASPEELCQVRVVLMKGALQASPSIAAKVILAGG